MSPVLFRTEHKIRLIVVLIVVVLIFYYLFGNNNDTTFKSLSHSDYMGEISNQAKLQLKGLTTLNKKLYLNNEEFVLLSGAIHYFRVVPEYWYDRLLKLRVSGLNTVETYVPWNLHEPSRGHFDFAGKLDILKFLQIADEIGLYVILRVGPFICAEWEFGGLPAWLLNDPEMKVRSLYPGFMEAADSYLTRILTLFDGYQYTQGGPIIAFQVENEYLSFGHDIGYMSALGRTEPIYSPKAEKFRNNGIVELLFTSDSEKIGELDVFDISDTKKVSDSQDKILMTVNWQDLQKGKELFQALRKYQSDKPIITMEFWTGWYDHWGERHHRTTLENYENALRFALTKGQGINLYMFHGGTSFGFMNGANTFNEAQPNAKYGPTVNSYDYDAPLSESGQITEKYKILRNLIDKLVPIELRCYRRSIKGSQGQKKISSPYELEPTIFGLYGPFDVTSYLPLRFMLSPLLSSIGIKYLASMERIDQLSGGVQSYGFALYTRVLSNLSKSEKHSLQFDRRSIQDRGMIFIDDQLVDIIDNSMLTPRMQSPNKEINKPDTMIKIEFIQKSTSTKLDILVENLGRVNFATDETVLNSQRKGIVGEILCDGAILHDWDYFPLSFESAYLQNVLDLDSWIPSPLTQVNPDHNQHGTWFDVPRNSPALFRIDFNIDETPHDTYLTLRNHWKPIESEKKYVNQTASSKLSKRELVENTQFSWTRGVAFLNGHHLGRYWFYPNSLYVPGPFLNQGSNTLLIFELQESFPSVVFLDHPTYFEN